MKFDELNQLKRFFSTMEISEGEKKKRSDFAYLLYDAIYFVFALIKVEKEIGERDFIVNKLVALQYKDTLENRLSDVFEREGIPYESDYLPKLVSEIIDTTDRHPDDPYYLSQDRALLIAQNESNSAYNYSDYITAKSEGKKYKTWFAEIDDKTRDWHLEVDSTRIPIDEMFHVGKDNMRFPHDMINGSAENIINCRCTCVYN